MNQKPERPDTDAAPGQTAGPGETPSAEAAEGPVACLPEWAVDSELILQKVPSPPGSAWIRRESTGYAVCKLSVVGPDGKRHELLLLCVCGKKLREALLSLRPIAESKLFDEIYERESLSGNLCPEEVADLFSNQNQRSNDD